MIDRALVIVPTYNERENIETLIADVLRMDSRLEILVVDDGSPDGTGALVKAQSDANPRVHLLERAKKLGLGTAYVAGFRWALARPYDCVLEMDADFSHDPAHLPAFLAAIEKNDLVLGSRYLGGKVTVVNWSIGRLMLSYCANVYAQAVTGLPLWDSTGGYKCFRKRVLASIDLDQVKSNGYAFQIEMSYRAWKKEFLMQEIPIVFADRREGASKMSAKIVREAIWMVWKLRWDNLTGRLH